MDKIYSTIRMCSLKCHVFDHEEDRVLCSVNRWNCRPFTINKTKYDIKEMIKRHKAFAKRRGKPNPYKYTCIRCEQVLEKLMVLMKKG